jgi:hypothetical protein
VNLRRIAVCMVTACLAATLATACAAKRPRLLNCRPEMNDREALRFGGYLHDGLVHFRIAYDHDVDPVHQKAFQGAMAMWNAQSHMTNFVFEDAKSSIVDFRLQRGGPVHHREQLDEIEASTCASYESAGSYIWYSRTGMVWMESSEDWLEHEIPFLFTHDPEFVAAARIYAHELGHALNLDHKKGGVGLMREGDPKRGCREIGMSILSDLQPADALEARVCADHVRAEAQAERERAKLRR